LKLVPATADLTCSIHHLLSVPSVYKYLADGQPPAKTIAHAWIAEAAQDQQFFGAGLWALTPADPKQVLCGLVRLSDHINGRMELTYLLHPDCWHLGLATRMAHTVLGECFKRGTVDAVWAGADEPNTASLAVMRRLGMAFIGFADYPLGRGLEYEIQSTNYAPERFDPIPVTTTGNQ